MVIAAVVVLPIAAFVLGLVATLSGPQLSHDRLGAAILGGLVFAGIGLLIASLPCLVAVVLAVVALLRQGHSKIAAIIALVVGAPVVVIGAALLISYASTLR